MVVSLSRMFKSLGQPVQAENEVQNGGDSDGTRFADGQMLPPIHYPSNLFDETQDSAEQQQPNILAENNISQGGLNCGSEHSQHKVNEQRSNQKLRAERVVDAVAQVHNQQSPTPLTDRYLEFRKNYQHPNRPPFDPATLWHLKHGKLPIMTELVNVVDEATLNAMPIEAVAILDRINQKLKRYREWTEELKDEQAEWACERQYVIDKLVAESIPEALKHYEQLLRFSPHRTKNSVVQGNMNAGDLLTDLFLEIDYELDELLDELHQIVMNKLASTHRYVKSRTQS